MLLSEHLEFVWDFLHFHPFLAPTGFKNATKLTPITIFHAPQLKIDVNANGLDAICSVFVIRRCMECICNSEVILLICPFFGPLREYNLRQRASHCLV